MTGWVAKQGLVFQLRYGASIQGAESTMIGTVIRLLTRLLFLLLIAVVVAWIYFANRVDYEWFQQDLGESISLALGAESATVTAVDGTRGHLVLQRVTLEGGEKSFFYDAEIRGLRTRMGFLDGMVGEWDGDLVIMESLDLSVKSGADSNEAATQAFQALFKVPENFDFQSIEVKSTTIRWGYTALHRGSIEGANLKARRRAEGGWQLIFTGGTFSQNWLRRFAIERMEVTVTEESVDFVEMRLTKEGGSVAMTGRLVSGGERPTLEGSGQIKGLPLWSVMDAEYWGFIDGNVSGDIRLSGSTNSQEGFAIEVDVELEERDHVTLYRRFLPLQAVSALDRQRSYKKVRFASGKFGMKTGVDRMELSDVKLASPGMMSLEGELLVRRPTEDEVDEKLNREKRPTVADGEEDENDEEGEEGEDEDITLKEAIEAEKVADLRSVDAVLNRLIRDERGGLSVKMASAAEDREMQSYYMIGQMKIGITADVFDRSPELNKAYPVDAESKLRWLDVPIKGRIGGIGEELAKDLYEKSKNRGGR